MNAKISLFLFIIFSFLIGCKQGSVESNSVQVIQNSIEAPFEMPAINEPDFSDCNEFTITDFDADTSDYKKTSEAIAQAITAANKAGCGTVVIPEGQWKTGKVHLKSNVNIHLKEGAELVFSSNPEDYLPAVKTTWEGMECYNYSPLIYAYECKNVAITGKGKLRAEMDVWKTWFDRPEPHMNSLKNLYTWAAEGLPVEERNMVTDTSHLRPQFIQFNRSENILVEGIEIENSPFWVLHPFLSKHITIRNVKVKAHGHNNDGVDPEMAQNMLIEDCIFDQGDDAIAVKSGRNQDAWRLNTPTKNLVVRNCLVKNGHQLLAIGSELSGGVENIYMENCEVEDGAKLNHLVYIKTNERRGGHVNNIYVKNIKSGRIDQGVLGVETDVLYQWRDLVPTYERRLTPIENIYLENFSVKDVEFLSKIEGQEEQPPTNIQLKNIQAEEIRGEKIINQHVESFQLTD